MICEQCGRDRRLIGWCPLCGFDRTAGPSMMRHVIDGHEVLLPVDAKLATRLTPESELDPDEELGGTY